MIIFKQNVEVKNEVLAVSEKIEKISEPETITLTKKIKCDSNQQQLYFEL
jgi:hypothetical protein